MQKSVNTMTARKLQNKYITQISEISQKNKHILSKSRSFSIKPTNITTLNENWNSRNSRFTDNDWTYSNSLNISEFNWAYTQYFEYMSIYVKIQVLECSIIHYENSSKFT